MGRAVLPAPPSPTLDASQLHAEFALGPQPRPEASESWPGEEEGGSWAWHTEAVPSSPFSSASQPRLSVKTYSSDVFTTCVLFLFYIGENFFFFFDTRPFRETFGKMHIQF